MAKIEKKIYVFLKEDGGGRRSQKKRTMTDFFKAIKEITAVAAQENCKKEIAEIKRNIELAAENGLFSYTFYRKNVSREQVRYEFSSFEDVLQMHFNCICLDWSTADTNTSSQFFNRIVKTTINAQKAKIAQLTNAIKEIITISAEKGCSEANFECACDFYDFIWKDYVATFFPEFKIEFSKRKFKFSW